MGLCIWDAKAGTLPGGGIPAVQTWPFQGPCTCFGDSGVQSTCGGSNPCPPCAPGRLPRVSLGTGTLLVDKISSLALTAILPQGSFPYSVLLRFSLNVTISNVIA